MSIPFIDLKSQYQSSKENIDSAIQRVLDHGQYIMGPEVAELESKLATHVGVKHALACSSGTDALVLPLMTKHLKRTDAIFTSPFTFFASAEAISLAGATPVFVDIDPKTYNLDPVKLEEAIQTVLASGTLTPKGIIPVDLFGIAADYDKISPIADKYELFVLEDAAQSFAANYHGRKTGSLGDAGATSFYPAKPLGCYGDGGAVFTNDSDLHAEMVSLRVHGQGTTGDKYDNIRVGLNARMDTIQAAILLEKLKFYDHEIALRNQVANKYNELLKNAVVTPFIPEGQSSVWAQYSVQASNRDTIRQALDEKGIPTAVFYPTPIHRSTAYRHLGYPTNCFPISEQVSTRIFSLPMHPYLSDEQIETIATAVISVAHP
ncbi:DegT/DnrJ/EryC1/StrS family aminotransferase [Arenicella xantha]|uniref:dTDP-4-amino-4,6-dideoxygalactose transaminase n=1 Tax=Arenicella xantha TaxID=644221 RepID=A0A395JLL7_9GAMM|nr:DegT/DnrJ/EryC1/StrS family aminotransferase [Arenicella xantha]RBP51499.1 dTDP-4-amino-4,6-dideoxygalactose transaminase [Arenicella xantha]